jgi:flagellin
MPSVNTNGAALVALQNLSRVNDSLDKTQNRISTGMKVSSAFDDGASFAVAQQLRSNIGSLGAVNERLSVAKGLTATTMSALENISNTMKDLKETTVKLADQSLDANSRLQYEDQYEKLALDINQFVKDATYNGENLLDGATAAVDVIANQSGDSLAIGARDMSDVLVDIGVTAGDPPTAAAPAAADAKAMLATIDTSASAVASAMNGVASDDRRITNQIKFNTSISDAVTKGLGAIVDADLAKESANLQSLQVRQQLATQSLSIANQAPQSLLSLFR